MWTFRKRKNQAVENWRARARWIDFRKTKLTIIYTAKAYMLSPADNNEVSNAKTYDETPKRGDSEERKETPNKDSDTDLTFEPMDN